MNIVNIPKIDLHCHLDGSIPIGVIRDILEDNAIQINQVQVDQNCTSLTRYLEKFNIPISCLQTKENLEKVAYSFMEDLSKENIKYIEVRFAPMLCTNENLSVLEVIESVLKGLQKGFCSFGIYYNVIVCAMRHHSMEHNMNMLKQARELLGYGVCALDLAGDETTFPTKNFKELFYEAKKMEMPFTIHSGECGSVQNVREALELGARRIGHGIALMKDRQLMEEFRKRRIGIEMCPTSNLQTKAIDCFENYPFHSFLEVGLLVNINTDNRMVSNTTMTKELTLINTNKEDSAIIYQILNNAIEMSFANDDVKNELTNCLK